MKMTSKKSSGGKNMQSPPAPGMEQFKGNPMNYRGMPKVVDNAQNRKPVTKND